MRRLSLVLSGSSSSVNRAGFAALVGVDKVHSDNTDVSKGLEEKQQQKNTFEVKYQVQVLHLDWHDSVV